MWDLFLNIMLRSSILYACETYYNLKETEIRILERIEEQFMRKLLKTNKSCPISQMYLELGQSPARFHIYKMRALFLKYILNESESSRILRFFYLQLENPVRGDWVTTCMKNLKALNIKNSIEEIRAMSAFNFKKLLNQKCEESALNYLIRRRGSKGKEIRYSKLKMADYMYPNDCLTITEQRSIFAIRNRMVAEIPANFCSNENNKYTCICKKKEDMQHIYYCTILNENEPKIEFKEIFNENIAKQKLIVKRFEANMESRNEKCNLKNEPCDPLDPLFSNVRIGLDNK